MMSALFVTAQTFLICANLYVVRAPDVGRQWANVCIEVAERATLTTVRPALAVAVTWHESRMRRDVVGALGEVGPMQVRPEMHCAGHCSDTIGAGLVVLARYVDRYGEARGMCRYRGAALDCESPRVALADRIDGVGR
jgi:hypothetical protein